VVGARLTFGNALLVVVIAGHRLRHRHPRRHEQGVKSSVLHHLLDTLLSIPSLLLAIIVVAILPGLFNTLIAITLALIPLFIRATYNAVHAEMQKEYIIASRLDGSADHASGHFAEHRRDPGDPDHPHPLAAILDISAVGFLGLGAQSPQPEWGPCWPIRAISSIWPLDRDPAGHGHPVQRAGDQPGGRRHSRSTQRGTTDVASLVIHPRPRTP
jgi:cationic peptide transport system permease protein